jgi:signal transduction histidine kinase
LDLTFTLHLLAGVGALGLGGGLLVRDPARGINRSFALLCCAIALWNLGFLTQLRPGAGARPFYLLGSCISGPLALHFALHLVGAGPRTRRLGLGLALVPAAVLWFGSFVPALSLGMAWYRAAMVVIGGTLAFALGVIALHAVRLNRGPERRAITLVLLGGIIATVGGVSDFIPRDADGITHLGPLAMMVFLLIVCAVLVQYRFLDVDLFVTRLVALLAGASAVGFLYQLAAGYDSSFTVFFLISLAVLAVAGPLGRLILRRAQSLLKPEGPLARALLSISRELPLANAAEEVWSTIERGRASLPDNVWIDVYLRRADQRRFHLTYRTRGGESRESDPMPADHPLPRTLVKDGMPVTRRYLERERRDGTPAATRQLAEETLAELQRLGIQLLIPLEAGEGVSGWIAVGGGLPEHQLTADVATEFMAVGNQAAAVLNRIAATEAARRSEALAAVGELAAGLAHEVRNPVAAIRGASQAMGPEATPRQREEMLEVIGEETGRLGRFVGEFLDYARPGLPRQEPVDLAAIARRCLKHFQLSGKSLQVELAVADDAPSVTGDPDQIQRAFDNLIQNAWEAAGDGGRLGIEVFSEGDGSVAIRFADDGPGIAADDMPNLFKPFQTTKAEGTGLGLALIHRIVEAHRGRVGVEGRPGVGAAFTLVFPAATDNESAPSENN